MARHGALGGARGRRGRARRVAAGGFRSPPGGRTAAGGAARSECLAIGGGSFISELVALAGARNAFGDIGAPSAVVSLEAVVARNPDVVLVLGLDSAAGSLGRQPGWSAIPAVRNGHVLAVQGSEFDRPSPRLPDAVGTLARRLAALETPH